MIQVLLSHLQRMGYTARKTSYPGTHHWKHVLSAYGRKNITVEWFSFGPECTGQILIISSGAGAWVAVPLNANETGFEWALLTVKRQLSSEELSALVEQKLQSTEQGPG